jgi:hypothetical protein
MLRSSPFGYDLALFPPTKHAEVTHLPHLNAEVKSQRLNGEGSAADWRDDWSSWNRFLPDKMCANGESLLDLGTDLEIDPLVAADPL